MIGKEKKWYKFEDIPDVDLYCDYPDLTMTDASQTPTLSSKKSE